MTNLREEMRTKIEERDKGWADVMALSKKFGFTILAYDGTAVLATNKNQLENLGEEKYLENQQRLFGGFYRPDTDQTTIKII